MANNCIFRVGQMGASMAKTWSRQQFNVTVFDFLNSQVLTVSGGWRNKYYVATSG